MEADDCGAWAKQTLQLLDKNVTRWRSDLAKIVGPQPQTPPMRPSDFLHTEAKTSLCEHYLAAGALCRISTNHESVLQAARATFLPVEAPGVAMDFSIRFWVDDTDRSQPPWPKPYVRGLGHLVFAGFDARSSFLVDLRTHRVIGRFSAAMAADHTYWRTIIFPILLSVLAGSIGLIELHSACVAKDNRGLILLGPSRSGKSTLAMALTAAGFCFLTDDRTFCSDARGKLMAWGLRRPLKLRREAAFWFAGLCDRRPMVVQDGESVFHLEPPPERVSNCEPKQLVFLERHDGCAFHLSVIKTREAKSRIETDLLPETPQGTRKQSGLLGALLSLDCCILRYGGSPHVIAERLAESFLKRSD